VEANQTTARLQEKVEWKMKGDMSTRNFTHVEHSMVHIQQEGLYGKIGA